MTKPKPFVINGWSIFAHPLFLDQIDDLEKQANKLRKKDPANYTKKNAAKRLAAISKLAFDVIPQDPTLTECRQGTPLGEQHKHWFRAKFSSNIVYSSASTQSPKSLSMPG